MFVLFEDGNAVALVRKPGCGGYTANASADTLQLNHYFTRSLEEMRLKIEKGRVSKDGRTKNTDHLHSQLEKLKKYTTQDSTILRFVPAVKKLKKEGNEPL